MLHQIYLSLEISLSVTPLKHILLLVQTKGLGQYGPLGLDMILIDDMKETLVSISELCKGGLLNKQNLVVFTWEGMRGFEMNEASRRAMKTLHEALSQYPGTARYFGFSRKIFNPGISLIPGTIAR